MKRKIVIFTHTGEVRHPKKYEWYYNDTSSMPYTQVFFESDRTVFEIVTRTETFEDWKPKEHEVVTCIMPEFKEPLQYRAYRNNQHSCLLDNGFIFPTRELAEQKLTEIKKLLQS